jgi:hypothetical protein
MAAFLGEAATQEVGRCRQGESVGVGPGGGLGEGGLLVYAAGSSMQQRFECLASEGPDCACPVRLAACMGEVATQKVGRCGQGACTWGKLTRPALMDGIGPVGLRIRRSSPRQYIWPMGSAMSPWQYDVIAPGSTLRLVALWCLPAVVCPHKCLVRERCWTFCWTPLAHTSAAC